MKGICYCEATGGCSQCVAGPWAEQQCCDFYSKHSFAERCTNLRPNDDNHCSSFRAQDFGRLVGVVRAEDIPEDDTVLSIDETGNVVENENHGCRDCILFPCQDVNETAKDKASRGYPLTEQHLRDLGAICGDFVDDETFAADVIKL